MSLIGCEGYVRWLENKLEKNRGTGWMTDEGERHSVCSSITFILVKYKDFLGGTEGDGCRDRLSRLVSRMSGDVRGELTEEEFAEEPEEVQEIFRFLREKRSMIDELGKVHGLGVEFKASDFVDEEYP